MTPFWSKHVVLKYTGNSRTVFGENWWFEKLHVSPDNISHFHYSLNQLNQLEQLCSVSIQMQFVSHHTGWLKLFYCDKTSEQSTTVSIDFSGYCELVILHNECCLLHHYNHRNNFILFHNIDCYVPRIHSLQINCSAQSFVILSSSWRKQNIDIWC